MKKTLTAAVMALAMIAGVVKSSYASVDGTPSTGSFSIVTNGSLAQATASGSLTVLSTSGLLGTVINVGAYQLRAGVDFLVGASTNATATNLAAAINATAVPITASATAGHNVVALVSDNPGTVGNGYGIASSTPSKVLASGSTLTGGRNAAVVSISGTSLTAGRDWIVSDVSSNTAKALAYAINTSPTLRLLVEAEPLSSTVYLRSLVLPSTLKLSSSAGSALTASQANMSGGSSGLLIRQNCFLGVVSSLPTSNYPAGCLAYLASDPTNLYLSTETVVGTQSWKAK